MSTEENYVAWSQVMDMYASSEETPEANLRPMNDVVEPTGGGTPHPNMDPVLAMNFIICTQVNGCDR
jgi:microcystin-dependent protein